MVSLFTEKKKEKQGEEQIRVRGKLRHQVKGLNISYTLIS